MRKDIEWLKNRLTNTLKFEAQNDREIGFKVAMEEVIELINQLDEPEVLSQEWVDENSELGQFITDKVINFDKFVKADKLKNLLVPKQELPVIPKIVAEAIEEDKECGYDVYESIDLIIGTNGGGLPSISDWVARNIDEYARAYLDGYTVEEEQKYYALNKNNKLMLKKYTRGVRELDISNSMTTDSEFFEFEKFALTEQEIKGYDERYMAFAKPVEGLEE